MSHLEALCLNVTLNALNNCLFLNKKQNLVLINNVTHQRETLSQRPIRQPLKTHLYNKAYIYCLYVLYIIHYIYV